VASDPFLPYSSRSAVVCRGVGKVWAAGTPRAHEALLGIDLEIAPAEFVVLLGPSGCGKSTLLYLVAGLEDTTSGELWSFGERIENPSPQRCLIFQEAALFPWLTVGQNVAFGLIEAADKRPDELSGGMRQRVAVARALAMQPKVLLMDEPFAALDVQTRAKMQNFLSEVWRGSGASVMFVTHHIDEAVALADRVVVFTARPGQIKTIVPVDLPRPRDPFSPGAEALRRHLTAQLQDEVDRAFAEQETLPAS
jgi:NitT/TauT family transport system ATP-binding protein